MTPARILTPPWQALAKATYTSPSMASQQLLPSLCAATCHQVHTHTRTQTNRTRPRPRHTHTYTHTNESVFAHAQPTQPHAEKSSYSGLVHPHSVWRYNAIHGSEGACTSFSEMVFVMMSVPRCVWCACVRRVRCLVVVRMCVCACFVCCVYVCVCKRASCCVHK